jgi:hypothetical protein
VPAGRVGIGRHFSFWTSCWKLQEEDLFQLHLRTAEKLVIDHRSSIIICQLEGEAKSTPLRQYGWLEWMNFGLSFNWTR